MFISANFLFDPRRFRGLILIGQRYFGRRPGKGIGEK